MPFECPTCKKVFLKEESLRQHVNSKHERTFKCSKCGKRFKTSSALNQHQEAKHRIIEFPFEKTKSVMAMDPSIGEPIIVRTEELVNEVSGFKCPDCGCEKAVYNNAHSPLFSKRSYLMIICSRCGKGFRDADY